MTALATASPLPQYFDLDGTPLDGGSIFFGLQDQNPLTAPTTVYWDAAATQPAAQPLRTLNGFVARAGAPAQLYASGNYSVSVYDKRGRLIYYSPNSANFSNADALRADLLDTSSPTKNAGMVGFLSTLAYAAGTVGRWLKALLSERISVSDYLPIGYVTDGSVDYTTQLQQAISAAIAAGAFLRGVPGTFQVTGTGLAVSGTLNFDMLGMVIKNNNGNVLRVGGSGFSPWGGQLWSVGGGHTIVQTAPIDQGNWRSMTIRQDSTAYSLWDNAGFDHVEMRHEHFYFQHVLLATVPGIKLVGPGGTINDNIWAKGRVKYSGNYFFDIESTTANWQYSNSLKKINFEVCKGGGVLQKAAMLFEIIDCQNWDCGPAAITQHFYSTQANASSIGSVGLFRGLGRWAGSNVGGIYDIQLPAGGLGAGIRVENCTTSGGGDPFVCDARGNGIFVVGTVSSLFSLINGGAAMIMQPGYAKGGLQWGTGLANLYPSATDTLTTDGTLIVATNMVAGAAAAYTGTHTVRKDSATLKSLQVLNGNATPFGGIGITYDGGAPNSTGSPFLSCDDSGATRAQIRSNGGLANFSANNVNLSDEDWKTDVQPLPSYWEKWKALNWFSYLHKDQPPEDTERSIGLMAQQVKAIAPEFVTELDMTSIVTPQTERVLEEACERIVSPAIEVLSPSGETVEIPAVMETVPAVTEIVPAVTKTQSVCGLYDNDITHAMGAVLKEALLRIEALEAKGN